MSTSVDLAVLRALVEGTKHGPVARRMIASAKLADALPALLDRLERAERDSQRMDWITQQVRNHSAFWALPCGADMRFVQLRTLGGVENFPTVEGDVRDAIDAAIALTPTPEQP